MRAERFPSARHSFQKVGVKMIFYKKDIPMPALKEKSKELKLSPYFHGKGIKNGVLYPEKSLNFLLKAGKLQGGFGVKAVFDEPPFIGLHAQSGYIFGDKKSGEKFVVCTDTGIYYLSLDAEISIPYFLSEQTFSRPPVGMRYVTKEGARVLFLAGEEGLFSFDGSVLSKDEAAPAALTGCVYYERIFLISAENPYKIYFSTPLQEVNFKAGYRAAGYTELSPEYGAACALIPCGKSLYALREHGVTKLSAESENYDFTATPLPCGYGKVYPSSAQAVGDKIIFLASDGLYAVKGNAVQKIASALTEGMNFTNEPDCVSFVYGGYYGLTYRTEEGARRTLFLDVDREEGYFSDITPVAPAFDGTDCFFLDEGSLSTFTVESARRFKPLKKVWESGYTRLGLGAGKKLLRGVTLFGKGAFKLTVQGEHVHETREFFLLLDGEKTVRPLIKSNGFYFYIESEDETCSLENMSITASIFGEDKA